MKFSQRLRLYLVGFGLGLVLVYIFFKDRNVSSWLPENRVKEQVTSSEIDFSESADCVNRCLNFSEDWVKEFVKTAEVDFSKSETRKEPCPVYQIAGAFKNIEIGMEIESCERTSTVLSIMEEGKRCNCD